MHHKSTVKGWYPLRYCISCSQNISCSPSVAPFAVLSAALFVLPLQYRPKLMRMWMFCVPSSTCVSLNCLCFSLALLVDACFAEHPFHPKPQLTRRCADNENNISADKNRKMRRRNIFLCGSKFTFSPPDAGGLGCNFRKRTMKM